MASARQVQNADRVTCSHTHRSYEYTHVRSRSQSRRCTGKLFQCRIGDRPESRRHVWSCPDRGEKNQWFFKLEICFFVFFIFYGFYGVLVF